MFTSILGNIMRLCYNIFHNYGLAIILFTFISKIILLPVSVWIQKNSIKMVKVEPQINKLKIKYFGDSDKIADETSKVYKSEKYNAFASIIPLLIQILILLCLTKVINNPLTYILNMKEEDINKYSSVYLSNRENSESALELLIVRDVKNNINKYENINQNLNKKIFKLNFDFLGFDLSTITINEKGITYLVPFLASLSALVMCICQNKMNMLQKFESKYNKYSTLVISVLLSLYLGFYVSLGVALYWIFSNLFAVLIQYLLNIFINPRKYVDYDLLVETNKELNDMKNLYKKKKRTKAQIKKEKNDYKRFFKVINKHLVFYSESNGFYKYYKGIIEYLLDNTNITIHYITSDYNDNIFKMAKENEQIKAYYIDSVKLITLMMKMDADVVVMTMPDIDNYHIKRSYVRSDITYIYIPHGLDSLNLTMREKSMNNYDIVYSATKYQYEENIKTNKLYDLKNRKVVKWGYSLLDEMILNYKKTNNKEDYILIAPSWQKDNIIDLCLEDILDNLKAEKYKVIVRPHPQQVKLMKNKIEALKEKYKNNSNIIIQTDFSSNDTIFNASILITDWSGIAYEYSFTTKNPVIFIDTPMKIMNDKYKDIDTIPFNIWTRNEIGKSIKIEDIKFLSKTIKNIINNKKKYSEKINQLLNDSVYNIGISSEVGANIIIEEINKKIKERKENK